MEELKNALITLQSLKPLDIKSKEYCYGRAIFMNTIVRNTFKPDEKFINWVLEKANSNQSYFQHYMGVVKGFMGTIFGHSYETDEKESIEWYTKAIENGNPFSHVDLGGMYGEDAAFFGYEPDSNKSFKLLSKVANEFDIYSPAYGKCYANGFGVEKNELMALKIYIKCADNCFMDAKSTGMSFVIGALQLAIKKLELKALLKQLDDQEKIKLDQIMNSTYEPLYTFTCNGGDKLTGTAGLFESLNDVDLVSVMDKTNEMKQITKDFEDSLKINDSNNDVIDSPVESGNSIKDAIAINIKQLENIQAQLKNTSTKINNYVDTIGPKLEDLEKDGKMDKLKEFIEGVNKIKKT